jgi:hypothetical protein
MARFDVLRVSLLTALTACGPAGVTDGSGSNSDATTASETGGECVALCEEPVFVADGFVRCSDGAINHVTGTPACEGTEDSMACSTDADCDANPNGKCIHTSTTDQATACSCVYGCQFGDNCGDEQVCVPPGLLAASPSTSATCGAASCSTNEDCGPCGECGLSGIDVSCEWVTTLACRTDADQCRSDADCLGDATCIPDDSGTWVCLSGGCDIGRPLLVDAVARTAAPQRRDDWSASLELPEDPELAAYWVEIAALEHASVASFARFATQLLALGAPPELLVATGRAALDEIEHAKLAYALASAYGGAPVGPGRLDLVGVEIDTSWRGVVRGLIIEACVGETVGVAEAMVAASSAEHPAVRAILERIVADELRHAQLGWRSLAYLLRDADAADRAWALALLDRVVDQTRARARDARAYGGLDRPADGALGGPGRAAIHREAVAEVLEPLARALA